MIGRRCRRRGVRQAVEKSGHIVELDLLGRGLCSCFSSDFDSKFRELSRCILCELQDVASGSLDKG
jgi:hypothetical protein